MDDKRRAGGKIRWFILLTSFCYSFAILRKKFDLIYIYIYICRSIIDKNEYNYQNINFSSSTWEIISRRLCRYKRKSNYFRIICPWKNALLLSFCHLIFLQSFCYLFWVFTSSIHFLVSTDGIRYLVDYAVFVGPWKARSNPLWINLRWKYKYSSKIRHTTLALSSHYSLLRTTLRDCPFWPSVQVAVMSQVIWCVVVMSRL